MLTRPVHLGGMIAARARDLYAVYCASSDGKNYQGNPCPAWDALPDAVRGHWCTVVRRTMQLDGVSPGAERETPPNDFTLDGAAVEVWQHYSEAA